MKSLRFFSHTKKKSFQLLKIAIATATLFAVLFGTVSQVFADPIRDELDQRFSSYLNLFNTTSHSPIINTGFLNHTTGDYVKGFTFDLDLSFALPSGEGATWGWNHINTPSGWTISSDNNDYKSGSFVIRLCQETGDKRCFLHRVLLARFLTVNPDSFHGLFYYRGNTPIPSNATTQIKTTVGAFGSPDQNKQYNSIGTSVNDTDYEEYEYNATDDSVSPLDNLVLPAGSALTADIWYCADNGEEATRPDIQGGANPVNLVTAENAYPDGYSKATPLNENVHTFGNICGGNTFFKIGNSTSFSIPADATGIDTGVTTGTQSLKTATAVNSGDGLPTCGVGGVLGGSIAGCAARVIYYIVFKPIAWLAGLFGRLFDFFIGYSISDESYRLGFAVRGWQLVRDICNILFILILVWTGFAAVFGISKFSMKQIVPNLIINAIIINFSLFATRTVIDLSNVTARVFYSRIYVCDGPCQSDGKGSYTNLKRDSLTGYWPLSEKIISSFNPQTILSPSVIGGSTLENTNVISTSNVCAGGFDTTHTGDCLQAQSSAEANSPPDAGYFIIVTLIAAFIMFCILKMFWGVAFMFLGRVIGLYIAMIFAPFAFVSRKIPFLEKLENLSYGNWSNDLTNYALLAPIFIFYLYIVYSFLSSNLISQIIPELTTHSNLSFFDKVLGIAVPMLIIYFLIDFGKKLASKYAGRIGSAVQNWVDKTVGGVGGVIGAGVGVAAGGAAVLGTRYGSRFGKAVGESSLGKWAASNADNNVLARGINNTLAKTQTGSWDLRKSKLYKGVDNTLALGGAKMKDKLTPAIANLTKPVTGNLLDLSEKRFEGGYKGQQERRKKEITKNIEDRIRYDHLSDDQAKLMWERRQNKKAEEKTLVEYAKKKDAEFKEKQDEIDVTDKKLKGEAKKLADMRRSIETDPTTTYKDSDIRNQEKVVRDTQDDLSERKEAQSIRLGNIKKTDYKKDEAYLNEFGQQRDKQRSDDVKKYGKVEKVKDFTAAMRKGYADDLQNNSFWMKDGKQRWASPSTGAAYGTGGALYAGLGAAVSTAVGAIMAERIKFEQEALDAATKEYVDKYGKSKGKNNRAEQLQEQIDEIDTIVNNHLKGIRDKIKAQADVGDARAKEEYKKHPLNKTDDEIKGMSDDEKKKMMEDYVYERQAEYDAATEEYKEAADAYRKERDVNKKAALKEKMKHRSREKKMKQDMFNEVNNIWERKEKVQDMQEKQREKDERTKDKGDKDKGDNKKDEKKDKEENEK